jgi:hypothetical protein
VSDDLRFPVGPFAFSEPPEKVRAESISRFREAPALLRKAVAGLTGDQLGARYRPGGWTLAQVVHHVAESDANAYPRLKYALTEATPPSVMVAPEELWAELADAKAVEIEGSLLMFDGIRRRWVEAWDSLSDRDFQRQWKHARFGLVSVDFLLQQYDWHARHHTAHITSHRSRMGW